MKYKFKKNKKTGEVLVNLMKAKNKNELRFYVHSNIYEASSKDITLIINTNRCIKKIAAIEIETLLNDANIDYKTYKIESDGERVFGIDISSIGGKKKKQSKRMYILNLTANDFTKSLFETVLCDFDIAVGINRKIEFESLCEEIRAEGVGEVLFNNEYFENSIYDSPIAMQLRTYVDVTKFSK